MKDLERALAAIEEDRLDDLRALLERDPALAGSRTEQGVSILLFARYRAKSEALETLLAAGPTLDVFDAAALGPIEVLDALLEGDISLLEAVSADGFRPLHLAAYCGHAQGAALLLECGAETGCVVEGAAGLQPLHSAVAGGHLAIVGYLIAAEADVDAVQQGGFTPLMGAAAGGHGRIVERLLDAGADAALQAGGKTAADLADEHGHAELAARIRE